MARQRLNRNWPAIAILLTLMLLGVAAAPALQRISLDNHIETWLAQDDSEAETLAWFRQLFPDEHRILVSWDGCSLSDQRSAAFAAHLVGTTDEGGMRVGGIREVASVDSPLQLLERIESRKVDSIEARRRLAGTLIGPDGLSAALLVKLSEQGAADLPRSLNAIRAAARDSGIESDELYLGGESVTTAALDKEVQRAMWNLRDPLAHPPVFLLSGAFGLFAAFVVLRSVRLGFMVLSAACLTALLGTALLPAFGRSMNMVVIVMPTLLIVLTLSAAIHLVNYWRHATSQGAPDPIREALRIGWLPCLLAAVTTGIGLLSLAINSLTPVRDFGLFSASGVMLSLAVVLTGIPAMLRLSSHAATPPREITRSFWTSLGRLLTRHHRVVGIAGLVILVSCAGGLLWFRTEVNVIRYFPSNSRLVEDSRYLEENIGGLAPIEVLIQFHEDTPREINFLQRMEIVRKVQEQIRQHPGISGAISLADFDSQSTPPPDNASTLKKMRYSKRSHIIESRIKRGDVDGTSRYLAVPSLRPGTEWTLRDPLDEVWRISGQALLLEDSDYDTLTQELNLLAEETLADLDGVSYAVTGTVPMFNRAQHALLESLTRSFALASAVIAIAMILLLRSVRAGILSMLPNLMPIAVVFGVMSWAGGTFDIGTMLTASVALGIAVDGALHLLTWFRKAIKEGQSRECAATYALQNCGPALAQTTFVVGVSLLMMYPAELLLISRFGWVMAALLFTALLAEVLFLPVLLVGPLGKLIQKSVAHTSTVAPPWVLPIPAGIRQPESRRGAGKRSA